jgi:hypothetical protein
LIYHQGNFDGACFLYSVINAYSAITGFEVEQSMWEEALKWIPFRADYLSDTGTQRIDDDFNLYAFTIHRITRELKCGNKIKAKGFVDVTSVVDVKKYINKSSVLIYNKKGHHWVVGVDYCQNGIESACSNELVNKRSKYQEYKSSNFGREYNSLQRYWKFGWLYHPSAIRLYIDDCS